MIIESKNATKWIYFVRKCNLESTPQNQFETSTGCQEANMMQRGVIIVMIAFINPRNEKGTA